MSNAITIPDLLPFYGVISENLSDVLTALLQNSRILYGVHIVETGETGIHGLVRDYSVYARGERFEFVDGRQKTRNIVYAILGKYMPIQVLTIPDSKEEFLFIKTDRIEPWNLGELLDSHICEWKSVQK